MPRREDLVRGTGSVGKDSGCRELCTAIRPLGRPRAGRLPRLPEGLRVGTRRKRGAGIRLYMVMQGALRGISKARADGSGQVVKGLLPSALHSAARVHSWASGRWGTNRELGKGTRGAAERTDHHTDGPANRHARVGVETVGNTA